MSPPSLAFPNIVSQAEYAWVSGLPPSPPPERYRKISLDRERVNPLDKPVVAVIGTGYVGSNLVKAFAEANIDVIAHDISDRCLKNLQNQLVAFKNIQYSLNPSDITPATHILIAVPTVLLPDMKTIDLSFVQTALSTVVNNARWGVTVIVESSVAVGTTRKLLAPCMQMYGFLGGMSPERIDPGRTVPSYEETPKIISGLNEESLQSIEKLYSKVFRKLVPVASPETAEMTKLYENCQRLMCISFANEMADACNAHGIDSSEVARAAATKPFGYAPFYPSLGIGGHCIPVNPYYLFSNSNFPLLRQAAEAARERPNRLADSLLENTSIPVDRLRILVVGVAFKRGQSNISNSPGVAYAKQLLARNVATVAYCDPLVAQESIPEVERYTDWSSEALDRDFDIIVIGLKQDGLDFSTLKRLTSCKVVWYCME